MIDVSNLIKHEQGYFNIDKILEKYHEAEYVGQFCLKDSSGCWVDDFAEVFYQPNPDTSKGHTHYFGIIIRAGTVYITKGDSGVEEPITALLSDDGTEIVYSRYRHDYRTNKDGNFIDGGRDYTRTSACGTIVSLQVINGKFYMNTKVSKQND